MCSLKLCSDKLVSLTGSSLAGKTFSWLTTSKLAVRKCGNWRKNEFEAFVQSHHYINCFFLLLLHPEVRKDPSKKRTLAGGFSGQTGQKDNWVCSTNDHKAGEGNEPEELLWVENSLEGQNGNPLQCCCLENPMDRVAWGHRAVIENPMDRAAWGHKELDTTEWLSLPHA